MNVASCIAFAIVLAVGISQADLCCADSPEPLALPSLKNAFRITDDVLMGATPEGHAGFEALRKLGVRTIISVDGARPNLLLAREFKLSYVHLPLGYEGISEDRRIELAKAVAVLPGPIFIHCHQGMHRGPAAAAVACIGSGRMSRESGRELLKIAGTSESYRGLHEAVATTRRIENLDSVSVVFPEAVQARPILESMVQINRSIERLIEIEKAGWKRSRLEAGVSPANEALMISEYFNELLRTNGMKDEPKEFKQIMRRSRNHAYKLSNDLKIRASSDFRHLSSLLAKIRDDCTRCHRDYRN